MLPRAHLPRVRWHFRRTHPSRRHHNVGYGERSGLEVAAVDFDGPLVRVCVLRETGNARGGPYVEVERVRVRFKPVSQLRGGCPDRPSFGKWHVWQMVVPCQMR